MSRFSRRHRLFLENTRMAVSTALDQRTRSILLVLGVAVGTATLLAMISLLFGLKGKLRDDILSAKRPYLNITKYDFLSASEYKEAARRRNFTVRDFQELEKRAETLDTVVFTRELAQGTPPPMLFYKDKRAEFIWVWGASEGAPQIFSMQLVEGRFITSDDIRRRRRVIVLGWGPWQELFPHSDPVGKMIRVGSERYRVVGAFGERKQLIGKMGENYAAIPYTTFAKDFGSENDQISIQATLKDGVSMARATSEVTGIMRNLRGLRPSQKNDFAIVASQTLQKLLDSLTLGVMLAIIVLSSIGLLVGGIGVMNMLLISVAERTREVGVRRAVGAKARDVLQQFLVEAIVLTGMGGAAGALGGFGLAQLLAQKAHFPFYWRIWMVALAVGFSMMVGLVFGAYPARRAARMQPIDALRNE